MKLELSNFKCHETKEFEFTENNVVLVSGKSGVGKTSIMEAIVFVLFGSGRKITKYGQKSCYVRLQIKVKDKILDIKRTKGPNRLTVEYSADGASADGARADADGDSSCTTGQYEDAGAQGIINELFGHQYESVGYLSQSSVNSFILMGPQEKLTFLENLVFKSSELKDTKQKIQNLIKERTQLLQTMIGKIEMLSQIIEEEGVGDCPEFPIRKKSGAVIICSAEQALAEKNLLIEGKNVLRKIESIEAKLAKLSTMLTAAVHHQSIMEENTTTMNKLSTQAHAIEEHICAAAAIDEDVQHADNNLVDRINRYIAISRDNGETLTKEYENNKVILKLIRTMKKYNNIVESLAAKTTQYDELFATEKENLHTEMVKYKEKVLGCDDIESLQEEISENIDFCQSISRYQELVKERDVQLRAVHENCRDLGTHGDEISLDAVDESFNNKISSYEKDIEDIGHIVQKLKLAGRPYSCPACSEHLSFCTKTNSLIKRQDQDLDLDSMEAKLLKKKKSLDSRRAQYSRFKRNRDTVVSIESKLKKLGNEYDLSDLESGAQDIKGIRERTHQLEDLIRANRENTGAYREIHSKLKHISLDNHILSDLLQNIGALQKSLDRFEKPEDMADQQDCMCDESELIAKNAKNAQDLEHSRSGLKKLIEIKDAVCECLRERESFEKKLAIGSHADKKLTIKSIRKHIENNTAEKDNYSILKQDYAERQHNLEKWKIKHQQWKKMIKHNDDLHMLEHRLLDIKAKLHSVFKLKEFLRTSETVLLELAIDQVNQYVANYLDLFFQTDPIIVMLAVKQEEKNTSRNGQLYISIDYKGMEADLSILSGGELQRVVIAYNLALSELFAVPVVLLDECTSNLDQELTETVVKGIKYNCKGKTIIMIAHQVVSGLFDNVILVT